MKLLFLCKRRPQGKDLLNRPYGRFYYLLKILAGKGHDVHQLVFSYKNDPKIVTHTDNINWTSVSLIKHGPFAYIREAKRIIEETRPDWIVGFSDTYYGILAQRLGAKNNIPSLIDAYDNYESYIPWLKPLHYQWQSSLAKATLVTAAGPSLVDLLGKCRPGRQTEIIPMAADPIFGPLDKIACRKKLNLPLNKKLIGYSGSTLVPNRGVETLFRAFESLKNELPDLQLVLTGRKGRGISIPQNATWLGYIPDDQMPLLMNSLDMLLVMNQPSSFGNYSYPVKLYEAMRCNIPVVVSETLSTKWIMKSNQDLLVEPNNTLELCDKIKSVLQQDRINYAEQMDWQQIGEKLERLLLKQ